ncbi:hypothetical protein Cob_v005194 [Colletotrichum orbiculare MAFF 240422]|uniref:Uncharacterized protein n=1 Tax=Colletotrichum orbiculare (strain 104-T / ATCC 96160 / CBS 514.97 / LARS 414 / MAFF 240422) TaxID=1213857 RepID=A0A484FXJ3_COLOR|nr:hypothetical protein Cob_v005194 [Colletotrichum orbiculare MAFF 240422]
MNSPLLTLGSRVCPVERASRNDLVLDREDSRRIPRPTWADHATLWWEDRAAAFAEAVERDLSLYRGSLGSDKGSVSRRAQVEEMSASYPPRKARYNTWAKVLHLTVTAGIRGHKSHWEEGPAKASSPPLPRLLLLLVPSTLYSRYLLAYDCR